MQTSDIAPLYKAQSVKAIRIGKKTMVLRFVRTPKYILWKKTKYLNAKKLVDGVTCVLSRVRRKFNGLQHIIN